MSDAERKEPSLLNELKRRRVVRVGLVYAAAAFVTIQAADLVFPRIPLPDWTVSLVVWLAILGFPVALALSWAFDITPEGVQRTAPVAGDGAEPATGNRLTGERRAAPRRPAGRVRRRALIAGSGAVVLFTVVVLGLQARRSGPTDPAPTPSANVLAVLPFEVRGGAEIAYLAEGIVDLLATQLGGVDQLRVVDVRALLDHVRRQPGDGAASTGEAAARRFGAGHFVLGSIVEFGGRMQLRATLYAQERPTAPLAEASAQGGETELFEMVDALAAQLLAGLSDGPAGRLSRIAALTTHSIDALKHYLAGERAYRAARFDEAMDHFGRAIRVDSTFALAAYRLAASADWAQDHDLVRSALERAHRHGDDLASRERALLDAYTAFALHRHGDAERMYRQIVRQYPDDIDAWFMLGELVFHDGRLFGYTIADALEPFERALALSPAHSAVLYHRMNVAALLGDTAGVLRYSERVLQESGDTALAYIDRAYVLADAALQRAIETKLPSIAEPVNAYYATVGSNHALGSQPEVPRRLWTTLIRSTPNRAVQAYGHAQLARYEAARGRFAAAAADLLEAVRLNEHLGWQERVRHALHPLGDVAPEALRPLRDSVRLWPAGPAEPLPGTLREYRFDSAGDAVRAYLIGALDVRIDPAAARRTVRDLAGRGGDDRIARAARDLAALLEAELARRDGDPGAALRHLEAAPFWNARPVRLATGTLAFEWPVFLRAELLREAGRSDDAGHWYRVAADHVVEYRAPALYRLCGLHEVAGRLAEARDACRRFLSLWQDADPELDPVLEDARRRLARMAVAEGGP